ncbi:BC1872 family protein [Anaerobacillus sp. CMMVII]|uniref:BC1872 family protein n=1 Tax=Anaerobacillus sp. CMMVII TaxID=2755588 RepID=UPI0037BF87B8
MNKIEIIARRLLGWKLNSSGNWYDFEKNTLIHVSKFQPDQNLEQAMIIVDSLKSSELPIQKKAILRFALMRFVLLAILLQKPLQMPPTQSLKITRSLMIGFKNQDPHSYGMWVLSSKLFFLSLPNKPDIAWIFPLKVYFINTR